LPTWRIEVKPTAEKRYLKLGKDMRRRIKESLHGLVESEDPLHHPQVRALTGDLNGDYRLCVGEWRVLFTPFREKRLLVVYAILPRGGAYR
jgi:mRNA interferase RelE/StbE